MDVGWWLGMMVATQSSPSPHFVPHPHPQQVLTSDLLLRKARKPRSRLAEELREPGHSCRKAGFVAVPDSSRGEAAISSAASSPRPSLCEACPRQGTPLERPCLGLTGLGFLQASLLRELPRLLGSNLGTKPPGERGGPRDLHLSRFSQTYRLRTGRRRGQSRGLPKPPPPLFPAASSRSHPRGRTCGAGGPRGPRPAAAAPAPPHPAAATSRVSASASAGAGEALAPHADPEQPRRPAPGPCPP